MRITSFWCTKTVGVFNLGAGLLSPRLNKLTGRRQRLAYSINDLLESFGKLSDSVNHFVRTALYFAHRFT